jgi:hypothetical protein
MLSVVVPRPASWTQVTLQLVLEFIPSRCRQRCELASDGRKSFDVQRVKRTRRSTSLRLLTFAKPTSDVPSRITENHQALLAAYNLPNTHL